MGNSLHCCRYRPHRCNRCPPCHSQWEANARLGRAYQLQRTPGDHVHDSEGHASSGCVPNHLAAKVGMVCRKSRTTSHTPAAVRFWQSRKHGRLESLTHSSIEGRSHLHGRSHPVRILPRGTGCSTGQSYSGVHGRRSRSQSVVAVRTLCASTSWLWRPSKWESVWYSRCRPYRSGPLSHHQSWQP